MTLLVELDFGSATDVGCVREINEDSMLADRALFVVADGMGGHAAGEVASALAVEHLAPLVGREDLAADDVLTTIADANAAILDHAVEHTATAGMGTTVSGICLGTVGGSPRWLVFNVGDSRVYRFADDAFEQVTVDHSEVAELVAAGRISSEQARTYPWRNVITRSLGSDPGPVPDILVLPIVAADRFLICTDGLTSEVSEDEIAAVLTAEPRPQVAAEVLVAKAIEAGGHDNVTVIVVQVAATP